MEWGDHLQFLLDLAEGGSSPKALESRIVMEDHLRFWWDAFWDMSSERPVHFGGLGRIPLSAIDCWARRYSIDDIDDFDALKAVIFAMDGVFLDRMAAKTKG